MQIKQSALAQQIRKNIAPLYVLLGQEHYLIEESIKAVKTTLQQQTEFDEKSISIEAADDWKALIDETNSYSLFADTQLIQVSYDKKTLDAGGKKFLDSYLQRQDSRCYLIIRAPNLSVKQLQWLHSHPNAIITVAYALTPVLMKQWVHNQLKIHQFNYTPIIPDLIVQYATGNLLACAQTIEKLSLIYEAGVTLSVEQVQEQLFNQNEYTLFELVEAYLSGNPAHVVQIIRHAAANKTEATLVLWLLSQEIRVMMQLLSHPQQEFKAACAQLKIWPSRIALYQQGLKRFDKKFLETLHGYAVKVDEQIKTNTSKHIWISLENLALSLTVGQFMGDVCTR
ncbi:MAG: DNA polymerase III subunit delta [Legionella sp. 40-6]|nr:DNA polymerase III subunit delta [Legionella sp.]OJX90992.1 MAG: DNA polymerase III subunit delta [Legionella sp. 40-6]